MPHAKLNRKGKGEVRPLLLELPLSLSLDLDAFSEAHYGAHKTRLLREALARFIEEELRNQPQLRQRFDKARARQREHPLRIVDSGKGER
jgi:hypothetical protein